MPKEDPNKAKNPKEKKEEPKPEYYNVEVDVLVPAVFKYRVFAKSAEDAVRELHKGSLTGREFNLNQIKKLKAKVYKFGTRMLELTKNL